MWKYVLAHVVIKIKDFHSSHTCVVRVALASHWCCSCCTRAACASFVLHSCCTHVSLVSHSCRSCLELALLNRLHPAAYAESLNMSLLLKLIDVHFTSVFTEDMCLHCLQLTIWTHSYLLLMCHCDSSFFISYSLFWIIQIEFLMMLFISTWMLFFYEQQIYMGYWCF